MIPETEKISDDDVVFAKERVNEMATRYHAWDLSDNDAAALRTLLAKIEEQERELETSWRLVSEAFEEFARCQYARVAPMPTDGSLDTRWMKEAEQFLKGGK